MLASLAPPDVDDADVKQNDDEVETHAGNIAKSRPKDDKFYEEVAAAVKDGGFALRNKAVARKWTKELKTDTELMKRYKDAGKNYAAQRGVRQKWLEGVFQDRKGESIKHASKSKWSCKGNFCTRRAYKRITPTPPRTTTTTTTANITFVFM